MKLEVIACPPLLQPRHLADRTVVVLDVLRATTTMIAALSHGATEIRIFESVEATLAAAGAFEGRKLVHGERHARPPPGFDLGNSPGDFTRDRCDGRTTFMTTTNGTGAILAAAGAPLVLVGAVVNASAVAEQLAHGDRDVTLLCAGQRSDVAIEDLLGAGAVIDRVRRRTVVDLANDAATAAAQLYAVNRHDLLHAFMQSVAVGSELCHGLLDDVKFAAVEDRFNVVGLFDRCCMSIKSAG